MRGMDFTVTDHSGRSILQSVLTTAWSVDYLILDALVSRGASITEKAAELAASRRDATLFQWLLKRGNDVLFRTWADLLVSRLSEDVESNAPFLQMLLEAGAAAPTGAALSILIKAAAAKAPELAAQLLKLG